MTCRSSHVKISPWLDGELNEKEIPELERHLSECPFCKGFCEVSMAINAGMRYKADILPPAELTDRVLDIASGTARSGPTVRFPTWLQAPIAAVLLFVAIGLGGFSGTRLSAILMPSGSEAVLMLVSPKDDISIEDLISGLDKEEVPR